jgi:hypothetical protein
VDVNNLLQQVYVYGLMEWQGSIKFINSFPSPRKGGMFALVSVLSVERDGIVEFKVGLTALWRMQPPNATQCSCRCSRSPFCSDRGWAVAHAQVGHSAAGVGQVLGSSR